MKISHQDITNPTGRLALEASQSVTALMSLMGKAVGLASLGICLVCLGGFLGVAGEALLPAQKAPPLAAARLGAVFHNPSPPSLASAPSTSKRQPLLSQTYGFPPSVPDPALTSPR